MASVLRTCCSLVLLVICLVSHSVQQNPIVMGPVDTSSAIGEDAVFYCKVRVGSSSNPTVYWVVDRSIGLGPFENDNPAYPQYEIFGNHLLGYYNLRITNVTITDAVRYDCVIDNPGQGSTYESGATLTVFNDPVTPSGPTCPARSSDIVIEEGEILEFQRCEAEGGVPVGELKWSLLRDDRSIVDIDYDIQVDDAGQITAVSGSYALTPDDHLSQMACSLNHPLVTNGVCSYPSGTGKIYVRHLPQIDLRPAISVHYLETTTVTVQCSASAYPDITFGPQLASSDPDMLFNVTKREPGFIEAIVEVAQSDVGTRINCSAVSPLGTTVATIEVELQRVLPSWLLIVVLICGIVVLLIFALVCCYCCCNGCRSEKTGTDRPDLADTKAAGYDVNDSRPGTLYKPNGLDNHAIDDDDGFSDIPLDDFIPPPPPPPPTNDIETGEVNDGYLSPDAADERFPPMIEDEHLMGEKRISTFKPDEGEEEVPPPPPTPPPPPPPEDYIVPIPSIEDD